MEVNVCGNLDTARELGRNLEYGDAIVMPAGLVRWMVERIDAAQEVYRLKRWGRLAMFAAGVCFGNAVCIAIVWWCKVAP